MFYLKPFALKTSINIIMTKAIPTRRALRSRTSEGQDRVEGHKLALEAAMAEQRTSRMRSANQSASRAQI